MFRSYGQRVSAAWGAAGVAGCLLLCVLAGCEKDQPADREPPHVTTPRFPEPRVADNPPLPAVVPPLRRAQLAAQDLPTPERLSAAMADGSGLGPVVTATADGAHIRIRAVLAPDAERIAADELKQLGFQADPDGGAESLVWARSVSNPERTAFEKLLVVRLGDAARRLSDLAMLELESRIPARMVWRRRGDTGVFLPGTLAYTGHPMDIALADAGKEPRLFFAAEGKDANSGAAARVYVRGGPLFVTDDGTLHLGDFKPAGEWQKVPDDAEQVVVRADGNVLAVTPGSAPVELGRLQVVRLGKLKPGPIAGTASSDEPPQPAELRIGASPLRAGHLEFAVAGDAGAEAMSLAAAQRILSAVFRALAQPAVPPAAGAGPAPLSGPIVIHADLAWTEQHLKALGVSVERTPGRTIIPLGHDAQKVAEALTKVLQGLRQRMAIHDQNLRNADRIRDAENRISPYRRKLVKIGPQGELVEEADATPFPRTYKPGDPNADGEGYITTPNVNRALETAEFQAAAEEYKLVRACMERLAPQQIFPDPLPVPAKPEGR